MKSKQTFVLGDAIEELKQLKDAYSLSITFGLVLIVIKLYICRV